MKKRLIMDCEVYKDYFLASFMSLDTGKVKEFELYDGHPIDRHGLSEMMRDHTVITFNGNAFDNWLLVRAMGQKPTNQGLKDLCDQLIAESHWTVARRYSLRIPSTWDGIDLIEVAPGQASLKIYGGRLHSPKLQDLPIDPSASIAPEQRAILRKYCRNDLHTTRDLNRALEKQIKLREDLSAKYKIDLRSKSDAQIAEALISSYLRDRGVDAVKRTTPVYGFRYVVPDWIKFESPELQEVLRAVLRAKFEVNDKGSIVLPATLNKVIEFAGGRYKFGIGGLHSQESRQVIRPAADEMFGEYDLTSMYPSIIIEQKLFPEHLGPTFLDVYQGIYNERVNAKRSGDKTLDATYKIALNGSYGKFGSRYSYLYSPELLIQTTITGQLSLLMMIERFAAVGARVVSANTDGINVVFKTADHGNIMSAVIGWELETGYNFEWTPYAACFSRDVNNYVALKASGGAKGKGAFADPSIMKNPSAEICILAVKAYLADGVAIEQTIHDCDDVRRFICVRSVTGGAIWRGQEIGKAVRWYYSTDGEPITYKKNGNKVPKTDGAAPLMDLPSCPPADLDRAWYIAEANAMLESLGC